MSQSEAIETPEAVRPRVSFRSGLGWSVLLMLLAMGVAAIAWTTQEGFYGSLNVSPGALVVWRVALSILGLATTALVFLGILAIRRSMQASQLAASGDLVEARVSAHKALTLRWYVSGLGLASLVGSFLFYFLAASNGAIRTVFLNWTLIQEALPSLLSGFWLNVRLFMVAEVIVLVWALFVAIVRLFPGRAGKPVRALAIAYADTFRGFPALITFYLIVIGLQAARIPFFVALGRANLLFWFAVLALVLVYGAYVAEVYRAGLESIHWSQTAAARSLGLSYFQTLRYVVVPQAVRRIIPPLLNDFIGLQKDTALLSTVGVLEITNKARFFASNNFNLSPMLGAGLAFLIITIPLARATDWLIKRDQERMRAG